MAWRTRSRRRGFGGSGGPLSWHTHGTRPPAGSVEWWPKGLASRMAISRVLEGNIRDRHQAPQPPPIGYTGRPPSVALMADVRSLFRSGTRAVCLPAGGCGPPQPPTSIHSASGRQAAFQPRPGQYLDADLWITAPRACQIRRRQEFPALRGPLDPCRASARRGMPPGRTRGLSLFLLSAGGGVSFLEVSAFVCEPARTSGRNLHGSSS